MSTEFWNERYAGSSLAYGEVPNEFLREVSTRFPAQGRALDLGAGEGRNAVFLASLGLDVLAVDQSEVGMRKAERWARERDLSLRTQVGDLATFDVPPASLDVVTSIYVHLPEALRADLHRRVVSWLRPGGFFVLEAYAPEQLARDTGGPRDASRLAPLGVIVGELAGVAIVHRAALTRTVREGQFHTGEADVVQVVGRRA